MTDGLAPYIWIGLLALALLLPGMKMLFGRGGARDAQGHRPFRLRPVRRVIGILLIALAGTSALLALSVVQFLRLTTDRPVALVELRQTAPQRFVASTSTEKDGTREYELSGDQWQIDARVVRWRLPALFAGLPPLYRLDRLSGRYEDVAQERTADRSVHGLDDWEIPDLGQLKRTFPRWLPFVDVVFGSGAYMPMFDNARYRVYVDPRGALFVRPDDAQTAAGLKTRGW